MTVHFETLPEEIQLIFVLLAQASCTAEKMEMPKERFLKFCNEIWDTMELNGADRLEDIIQNYQLTKISESTLGFKHD